MKNRSNRTFALALKQAVYKNILRQDTEYFDKVKTGVLQERLNSDTAHISGMALDVPVDILRCEILRGPITTPGAPAPAIASNCCLFFGLRDQPSSQERRLHRWHRPRPAPSEQEAQPGRHVLPAVHCGTY